MQAEVLNLYDPDRSKTVLNGGREDTWPRFEEMLLSDAREERLGARAFAF